MLEARIVSANSLSGLESMFNLVLLVCRVGVYVTRRSVKDHGRAEATHTPLTLTPPVCKELSRLSDTVRVSTNKSYPLGSLFMQQTFVEPEPKVWGPTLASENVTSEAGALCGRHWCVSHSGTEHSNGEGEFQHRRNYAPWTTKREYSLLPSGSMRLRFHGGNTVCEPGRQRNWRHGGDTRWSSHLNLESQQLCSFFFQP